MLADYCFNFFPCVLDASAIAAQEVSGARERSPCAGALRVIDVVCEREFRVLDGIGFTTLFQKVHERLK
jgi:hypothetical protein